MVFNQFPPFQMLYVTPQKIAGICKQRKGLIKKRKKYAILAYSGGRNKRCRTGVPASESSDSAYEIFPPPFFFPRLLGDTLLERGIVIH